MPTARRRWTFLPMCCCRRLRRPIAICSAGADRHGGLKWRQLTREDDVDAHPFRRRVDALLAQAGVHPDGGATTDPVIHDDRFHRRVLAQGSLGLGESYMEGWWDVESLDG